MTRAQKAAATRAAYRIQAERRTAEQARIRAIVATGKCPLCASPLRRNTSLTGWWQCSQYGAPGFRAIASKAPCEWQGFTE